MNDSVTLVQDQISLLHGHVPRPPVMAVNLERPVLPLPLKDLDNRGYYTRARSYRVSVWREHAAMSGVRSEANEGGVSEQSEGERLTDCNCV